MGTGSLLKMVQITGRIHNQSGAVIYEFPLFEDWRTPARRYRVIHERERTVSTAAGKIQNRVKNEK